MTASPTERFYEELPVFDDFAGITEARQFRPLPAEWHVVVADIEGSTAAIARGLYKQVNVVGAAAIVAVLNVVRLAKVPFVFGGDGATLCVPESTLGAVRQALVATKLMAAREFGLALRIGIVPVREIEAAGHRVLVARYRASKQYLQAIFSGGGIAYAEACVKDPSRGRRFRIVPREVEVSGGFEGLECRWDDIPSPHGETITLVVRAEGNEAERPAIYRDVIREIRHVYGDVEVCRPVRLGQMPLARSNQKLGVEVLVRTSGRGRFVRAAYWLRLKAQMVVGYLAFPRHMTVAGVDWGQYQREVVANTDCRKFDDLLRQVLSGTPEQRSELARFLEEKQRAGELVYGLHAAPSALMTCLVFNRHGDHVHFVDGSGGGYAMAALQMKEQARRTDEG